LDSAWPVKSFAILVQSTSYQVCEIHTYFHQESGMVVYNVKTFLPNRGAALHATKLSVEQSIESVEVMLSPANAGTTHYAREALLVDTDGVLDQGEINVGNLEDVKW
jgi:hypothetical protein